MLGLTFSFCQRMNGWSWQNEALLKINKIGLSDILQRIPPEVSVARLQCLSKMNCSMGAPSENGCRGQRAGVCCGIQGCKSEGSAQKWVGWWGKKDDSYSLSHQKRPSNALLWDSLLVPAQAGESQSGLLSETRGVQCFWKTEAELGTFSAPKVPCDLTLVEGVIVFLCDILSTPCSWLSVHFVTDMLNSTSFTLFCRGVSYTGLKQHVLSWILSFVLCPSYSFLSLSCGYSTPLPGAAVWSLSPLGRWMGGGGQSKRGRAVQSVCGGGIT